MRKYFLLSAVALMAASTANATEGASNLTASATIITPTDVMCTPIDFGTLYFKTTNSVGSRSEFEINSTGLITQEYNDGYYRLYGNSAQGTPGTCTGLPEGATFEAYDAIYFDEAKQIYISDVNYANGKLTCRFFIEPDAVLDGSEMTASAVVRFTY
ncbi:MAG: hypothetical protein E7016_06035 [Alphaproteobacteria bacterium]|nr:hypothetical protein [Alphaproteobacteria bacterium]